MNRLIKKIKRRFIKDEFVTLQERISGEVERASQIQQEFFPDRILLPPAYGIGMPERVVELLFAKISISHSQDIRVLDIGYANAMDCHKKLIKSLPEPAFLTGLDIALPKYNTLPYYTQILIGDITIAPIKNESFDIIWCLSSLEHFGMDNSSYTTNYRRGQDLDKIALNEMIRILNKGGHLIVTVPYGKYEDHGWLKNYDWEHWQNLLEAIRPGSRIGEYYFRHTFGNGWYICDPEELTYVGYYDQHNYGAGALAIAYITKL